MCRISQPTSASCAYDLGLQREYACCGQKKLQHICSQNFSDLYIIHLRTFQILTKKFATVFILPLKDHSMSVSQTPLTWLPAWGKSWFYSSVQSLIITFLFLLIGTPLLNTSSPVFFLNCRQLSKHNRWFSYFSKKRVNKKLLSISLNLDPRPSRNYSRPLDYSKTDDVCLEQEEGLIKLTYFFFPLLLELADNS